MATLRLLLLNILGNIRTSFKLLLQLEKNIRNLGL